MRSVNKLITCLTFALCSILPLSSVEAGVPCSVPFTLTNGTTADATQVMANYNAILSCLGNAAAAGANSDITSLNALTSPIPPIAGGSNVFIATASTGGSANAQTVASTTPSGFVLTLNYSVIAKIGIANTGPMTLTVGSSASTNVFKPGFGGPVALVGGELQIGDIVHFVYDGTQYQIVGAITPVANQTIQSNISGGSALPASNTLTALLDNIMGSTRGQILVRGASAWGTLSLGTNNQQLASNGTDLVYINPTRVLLNTLTASNSATLSDTTSLTNAFSEYKILLQNIVPVTNAVGLQLQVHSGGSFKTTGYINSTLQANTSTTVSNSTTQVDLTRNSTVDVSNVASNGGVSGELFVMNPSVSSTIHFFSGPNSYVNTVTAASALTQVSGAWDTAGAVDGFQILFSSGNISSGTIKIYGIP